MTPKVASPAELKAKATSRGEWAQTANVNIDHRYLKPYPRMRRRCGLDGCRVRATHVGMCNGLGMTYGCEWHMRVWAKERQR